jgi:hypothetical protein
LAIILICVEYWIHFSLKTLKNYGIRIKPAHDTWTESPHQPHSCTQHNHHVTSAIPQHDQPCPAVYWYRRQTLPNSFYDGISFQHLATVFISVFTPCYWPALLFRGPLCIIHTNTTFEHSTFICFIMLHVSAAKFANEQLWSTCRQPNVKVETCQFIQMTFCNDVTTYFLKCLHCTYYSRNLIFSIPKCYKNITI